jgi:Tol biopolymer transport system component
VPLSPTTTAVPVPPRFATSTYLLDLATGGRIWPPPVVEGFMVGDTAVSSYVPSADGTRVLAFTLCALTAPCPGSNRLAVGKIDGSNVRTIAVPDGRRAVSAGWSLDGTKIVYAARDASNREEIFIEDLTTRATNQITHFERPGASLSPTFTLDGQSVLFMLPRGQYPYSDVWSMPVTGGEPTLVIETAEFPEPLPDGTIAFARFFWSGLWVTSIDDPGSARPLIPPREMVNEVAASPDGRRLAYVRPWVGPSTAGQGAVIIVDADTGGVETVLDRAISAEWLDNETLIFTELTPVGD